MFLTHKNSLTDNEFEVLSQYNNEYILLNGSQWELISNICPHQRSLISVKSGSGNRVCPYHNWSFTASGLPLTSGRTEHYCKNQNPLQTLPAYVWNSLVFSHPVDFEVPVDFSNLTLMEKRIDVVKSSNINIMDLFLDVDHIPTLHAGVYDKIGITDFSDIKWKYYNNGSTQLVYDKNGLSAAWIAVYPYTMIEWQRGSLFVTVAIENQNKEHSNVHVFKYTSGNENWSLNNSVWETAWFQDRTQAELINKVNFENLEIQKLHYRNYLNQWN